MNISSHGGQAWSYIVFCEKQSYETNNIFMEFRCPAMVTWWQFHWWHRHSPYLNSYFKRLWSSGIDSKEWIPPAYVARQAGTITLLLAPIDRFKIPALYQHTLCEVWLERGEQRVSNYLKRALPRGRLIRLSSAGSWLKETSCWRERGEGDGRGAKSYDWSSINHSILSGGES